jgi:hypothetical protein
MHKVAIDKRYGDIRATCPYCGHCCVVTLKNRGDICSHLSGEDQRKELFIFEI